MILHHCRPFKEEAVPRSSIWKQCAWQGLKIIPAGLFPANVSGVHACRAQTCAQPPPESEQMGSYVACVQGPSFDGRTACGGTSLPRPEASWA